MGCYSLAKLLESTIRLFKNYKQLLILYIYFLLIGAVFRTILLLVHSDLNSEYFYTLIYGFRMDTIVFSGLWAIFIFLYIFNLNKALSILLSITLSIYILLEIVTVFYMQEFVARPSILLVEHLGNYEEIFQMIFGIYPVYSILLILIVSASIYGSYKFFTKILDRRPILEKLYLFPVVLIILFIGLRSSFDSSTPNSSFYSFSNDNIKNEIANNTTFSILYSVYQTKNEKSYKYGDLPNEEAIQNIKNIYNIDSDQNNLKRVQESSFEGKKNIILVVLEGIGHENVGYLGGRDVTSNLDALTKESMYFTNMYAVSNRTSWGISSILSSLYPIPSREYVKASKSARDFYTIASSLKKHNYENIFLYAGDANFDNMRGFMLANGYDSVYGKESFDSSLKKYTWGYSDEDLFDKAIEMIETKTSKPLFLTMLTLSSHKPFDYPYEKISPYKDMDLKSFTNSIKYADYAIGKFIAKLKEKKLLENTIVAFISDHTEKVSGSFDVPIDKYKIPAIILSNEFQKSPKEYSKIASQIDFAPTLLDIAGVSDTIPTMGASILKHQRDSAILLYKNRNFAYLRPDKFVIFKPKKQIQTYNYELQKIQESKKDVDDGLSFINAAKAIYDSKEYN
jgi:phosphoglycerol transferase MdoB-like AlkP superfamily enzyme